MVARLRLPTTDFNVSHWFVRLGASRSWALGGRRGLGVVYNVNSDTYVARAIEKEYLKLSAIVTEFAQEKVSAFR